METFLFCWQDLPPAAPLHPLEPDLAGSFLRDFSSRASALPCGIRAAFHAPAWQRLTAAEWSGAGKSEKKAVRVRARAWLSARVGAKSASLSPPSAECLVVGASDSMGCGLRKLEDPEDSSPGKIYSTLKRAQVETKTDTVYEYVLLDFSLEGRLQRERLQSGILLTPDDSKQTNVSWWRRKQSMSARLHFWQKYSTAEGQTFNSDVNIQLKSVSWSFYKLQ